MYKAKLCFVAKVWASESWVRALKLRVRVGRVYRSLLSSWPVLVVLPRHLVQ